MSRRAERHSLGRHRGIGDLGVVGGDQLRDVEQHRGGRRMSRQGADFHDAVSSSAAAARSTNHWMRPRVGTISCAGSSLRIAGSFEYALEHVRLRATRHQKQKLGRGIQDRGCQRDSPHRDRGHVVRHHPARLLIDNRAFRKDRCRMSVVAESEQSEIDAAGRERWRVDPSTFETACAAVASYGCGCADGIIFAMDAMDVRGRNRHVIEQ